MGRVVFDEVMSLVGSVLEPELDLVVVKVAAVSRRKLSREKRYKCIIHLEGKLHLINWTLLFTYKINSFFCIDLPFGGNHIYPIPGMPFKFGKDIFNIKAVVLIFQKDPFIFYVNHVDSNSAFLLNVIF